MSPDPVAAKSTTHPPPTSRWAVFVRSARPAAIWMMVAGLFLQVIALPLAGLVNPHAVALINIEIARLLAEGVLGLGAFRSIDKLLGKAT